MIPRRMSDVARAAGGALQGDDVEVTHVVTNSKEAAPGALFFALRGERTDGALFVPEAFANGAAGAVVSSGTKVDGPAVHVRSTTEALMKLSADERSRTNSTVIAITGANGKTSTKDLAASVLRVRFRVHASPESFNNEVGLPFTVLSAPTATEVVVAEMGARHPGDVARLCEIARPHVVVVTNVGVAHMEMFGSWDAIVAASAEPVEALDEAGVAILSADDPVTAGLTSPTGARVVTFGLSESADVRAEEVHLDAQGRASFRLSHGGMREPVELAVPGEHMVPNALAAAACGLALGMTPAECASGLKGARVSRWRMETFTGSGGVRVVNDAYNANPESMAAALRAARWVARETRLIAVLGAMAELGPISLEEHERLGELVARIGVGRLVTVGEGARPIAMAAVREGMQPEDVASYPDPGGALVDVRAHARSGDVVLCKASRVEGLERLAEALR